MLKNVSFYQLGDSVLQHVAQLDTLLGAQQLSAIGALELRRVGFVPPIEGADTFVLSVGQAHLFVLGGWRKTLPAQAVNARVSEQVKRIEAGGGTVTRRDRQRLKDEARTELLARLVPTPFRIHAYIDEARALLVVGTAVARQAEEVIAQLRLALGSCEAFPMAPEASTTQVMTTWLLDQSLPEGVVLGQEIELRDPADKAAMIRGTAVDLDADEIRQHAAAGRRVTRMGLIVDGGLACVVDQHLVLRKTRLLDLAPAADGEDDDGDPARELQTRLAVFSGALGQAYDRIRPAFDAAA